MSTSKVKPGICIRWIFQHFTTYITLFSLLFRKPLRDKAVEGVRLVGPYGTEEEKRGSLRVWKEWDGMWQKKDGGPYRGGRTAG